MTKQIEILLKIGRSIDKEGRVRLSKEKLKPNTGSQAHTKK
jgi:hypothetical protein